MGFLPQRPRVGPVPAKRSENYLQCGLTSNKQEQGAQRHIPPKQPATKTQEQQKTARSQWCVPPFWHHLPRKPTGTSCKATSSAFFRTGVYTPLARVKHLSRYMPHRAVTPAHHFLSAAWSNDGYDCALWGLPELGLRGPSRSKQTTVPRPPLRLLSQAQP